MNQFLGGMICGFHLIIALLFARFYRRTGDRLFLFFAGAFLTFAANALVILVLNISAEERSPVYVIRLAGFLLILVAIVDKNRRPRGGGGGPVPPK